MHTTNLSNPLNQDTKSSNELLKVSNLIPDLEKTFLAADTTLGKYRILDEIDRGGMAVIYRAEQIDLKRIVALKVLPLNITLNPLFVERFFTEAQSVAHLNHPNIVNIHDVATENNIYFLVMDYIPGKNLYYYLHFSKPKIIEVIEITIKLADAMAYAHRQKIIHRDLKLNNVIMKDKGLPVLIDFGLAKAMEGNEKNLTQTGEVIGSPAYMAPERLISGATDHRSDICSLGIMLYEMLTFKNPYLDPRNLHQTAKNVMEANPISPRKLVPWLPPEIEAITLKAMHREPDKRYQTMEELRDDLLRYQRGDRVLATSPSLRSRIKQRVRRNQLSLSITAIVLAFSLIFGLYYIQQNNKEQARWQLVYHQNFDKLSGASGALTDWETPQLTHRQNGDSWHIRDGALIVPQGPSYLRFNRQFVRDMRIEFDVVADSGNLFNIGFFLYGIAPDSAYRFFINTKGTTGFGITLPGSTIIWHDYNPLEFVMSQNYHVVIERKENTLSFFLNNTLISRLFDYSPHRGENYRQCGFFTSGGQAKIDNLQIFRMAAPQLSTPTIIGDRFFDYGNFNAALTEYRELLLDYSSASMIAAIKLKIADCLIYNHSDSTALSELHSVKIFRPTTSLEHQKRLYLKEQVLRRQGNTLAADSLITKLYILDPTSPFFRSVLFSELVSVFNRFAHAHQSDEAARITTLARRYAAYGRSISEIHLRMLDYYGESGQIEKAAQLTDTIIECYRMVPGVIPEAKLLLGKAYLARGMRQKAAGLYNDCSSSLFVASPAYWNSWMQIAELYEFDRNLNDAYSIYKKVYLESRSSLDIAWLARCKMGEIAALTTQEENPTEIFQSIRNGSHPFPLPRLIARYYLDELSVEAFGANWQKLKGHADTWYRYHVAQRALIEQDSAAAHSLLSALRKEYSNNFWTASMLERRQNALE